MWNAKAASLNNIAQVDGRSCIQGRSTATACTEKRRPGTKQSSFAMAKMVTWLLSPTTRSTTTSMERMHKSGWEEQIKVVKETGDGWIAVSGVSPCGLLDNPTMGMRLLTSFSLTQKIVFSWGTEVQTSGVMLSAVTKNGSSAPKSYVLQQHQV